MWRFFSWQPGRVTFGRGSIEKVGEEAARLGDKCLLVTGKHFAKKYGYTDKLVKLLTDAGLKVEVYSGAEPNPPFECVDRGAEVAKKVGADVIVAFGGGSAMDTAKAIAVVQTLGGSAANYVFPYVVEEEVTPIVAIPTTAGTGSEVTRYSVLTDTKARKKVVVVGYPIIPKSAILDAEVLSHMSPELTAWTGFDALSHAIEAYLSKKACALTELYSLEAVRLIFKHLPAAVKGSLDDREKVFYASMLAGMAINISGTTMVHGLGYYLTAYHGVQHGLANAMLLPYCVEYTEPAVPERVEKLASAVGAEGLKGFLEALYRLEDETGIPKSLKELGVSEGEMDVIVRESLGYRRNLDNNPRPVDDAAVREVYLKAIRGRLS